MTSTARLVRTGSTNNNHLAIEGRVLCNARIIADDAHTFDTAKAWIAWNDCPKCAARLVKMTGDAFAADRVVEDAFAVEMPAMTLVG